MRKSTVVFSILIMFLLLTAVASASGPDLEPFSTTGYTTNLVPNPYYVPPPSLSNPPAFPSDFTPLAGGYTKFHISAQGGPAVDDDAQCLALYGAPCQALCLGLTGSACGTTGAFPAGSFSFEEWGLYYPASPSPTAGANYGLLNISTAGGQSDMRFGGLTVLDFSGYPDISLGVTGSFQVLDGSGDYKKLKGEGSYAGDADFVFTVDYTPTAELQGCAAFGGDFKLKKDKVEWEIENEAASDLTVSKISVWWPAETPLDKVKYGGKTVLEPGDDSGYAAIDLSGWEGKEKDLLLKANGKEKLKIEFGAKDISQLASDYTILVEFSNGCAVPFVAFE